MANWSNEESVGSDDSNPDVEELRQKRKRRWRDPVWELFEPVPGEPQTQRCKRCSATIKTHRSSKTGLLTHVKHHERMFKIVSRDKLKAWLVASMVTILNFPLNVFNSLIMKIAFWLMRLGTVNDAIARQLTDGETGRLKAVLAKDIQELKKTKAVFTLTCDEWTWRRRRFLGVTLHCSTVIPCLGSTSSVILSRLHDRATATNLKKNLEEALANLGLELTDISGMTTDGASVMKKLGRLLSDAAGSRPFFHHLCYAHGIHLAVLDTLLSRSLTTSDSCSEEPANEPSIFVGIRGRPENVEEESEAADTPEYEYDDTESDEEDEPLQYAGTVGDLIERIRIECKRFQKSPVLNDELMAVAKDGYRQIQLQVDNRTRWNSVLRMLKSFLESVPALQAFYERPTETRAFPFTENDLENVKKIVAALAHVETAVLRLSFADATLLDAELAIETMFEQLDREPSPFAKTLRSNLGIRILQRRGIISRLARYVETREETSDLDVWIECIRQQMISEGRETLLRTFKEPGDFVDVIGKIMGRDAGNTESHREQEVNDLASATSDRPVDRYAAFKERQKQGRLEPATLPARRLMKLHSEGLRVFPEWLYSMLKTLQPTSVPAERIFSSARHSRRYSQGRQVDQRFADFLFLKYFYMKSKPWDAFKAEHSMTSECRLGFS